MAVAGAAQAIRVSERPVPGKPSGGMRPLLDGHRPEIAARKQTLRSSVRLWETPTKSLSMADHTELENPRDSPRREVP